MCKRKQKKEVTSVFPFVVLNVNEKRKNGSQLPFFLLSFWFVNENEKRKSTSVFSFFVFNKKKTSMNMGKRKQRGKKGGTKQLGGCLGENRHQQMWGQGNRDERKGGTKELGEGCLDSRLRQCPGCLEVCLVSSSKLRVCAVNWRFI